MGKTTPAEQAKLEREGMDSLIKRWLTSNRPWSLNSETDEFIKTRNDCSVYEPQDVIQRTHELLQEVGILDASTTVDDRGTLRVAIPHQSFDAEKIASLNGAPRISVNLGNQSSRR